MPATRPATYGKPPKTLKREDATGASLTSSGKNAGTPDWPFWLLILFKSLRLYMAVTHRQPRRRLEPL